MPESRLRPPELAPGGRKSRINTTQTRVSNQFQVGNRRNTQGICAGAGYFNKFLDEFTFRLNEGSVKIHTLDRIDSLLEKSVGTRITYKQLVSSKRE